MGLFCDVRVPQELLPDEAKSLTGWQTKDVINPDMSTLEITLDGELVHEWWEYEPIENPKKWGPYFRRVARHRDRLNYHGDMVFYTGSEEDPNTLTWELIECRARFSEGRLEAISFLGPLDVVAQ